MILLRSFATLSEYFNHVFGTHSNVPVYSFGFFVAMSFLIGGWILNLELKRKERKGLFHPTKAKIIVGNPATPAELFFNGLVGFIIGWKIIGIVTENKIFSENPQAYILSSQGSILGGLLIAGVLIYLKWREKNKEKLDQPKEKTIDIWPHHRVGDFIVIAAVFGLLGAKIFSNFEEENGWRDFIKNPVENFFSGLTIYGGLILAAAAIIYFAWRKKINVLHLGDAFAPALILAYGIGRIGCQVAGDGDWGILNSAYISTPDAKVELAQEGDFQKALFANQNYYIQQFGSIENVPHVNFKAPDFLPQRLVAQNYAYNVNNEGAAIEGCETGWCGQLPVAVFPTPVYETIMSLIIFGFLWMIRKRITIPGMLLAFYVFLNGAERYFIEKIRVNNVLNFMGIHATQATFISVGFMLFGLLLMYLFWRRSKKPA